MTATDVLAPGDLAIDHELADTAASLRFLLDVTPDNLVAARTQFLKDGRTPNFTYGTLGDHTVARARLAKIDVASVNDAALAHLLTAKRRELELQLDMLACRGTARFRELSLQLYGTVSPALLGDAESLLQDVTVPPTEGGRRLGADEFRARVEQELDHYRSQHVDLDVAVEIRTDSTGVMVADGRVMIAPTVAVPEARVNALLQHEVGTHVVTHVNGAHQPLRLLGAGLAGYDETQEGLAVFAEYLAGGLTARRLRQLAARVVAVHQMTDGASFPAVHRGLVECGVARTEAFTITARVFRAGGLTKDAVYLRGLRSILTHIGAGGPLDSLLVGKMSLTDVPHVEELRERGVLDDPLLRPHYLDHADARQRLEAITASTTPIDLIVAPS